MMKTSASIRFPKGFVEATGIDAVDLDEIHPILESTFGASRRRVEQFPAKGLMKQAVSLEIGHVNESVLKLRFAKGTTRLCEVETQRKLTEKELEHIAETVRRARSKEGAGWHHSWLISKLEVRGGYQAPDLKIDPTPLEALGKSKAPNYPFLLWARYFDVGDRMPLNEHRKSRAVRQAGLLLSLFVNTPITTQALYGNEMVWGRSAESMSVNQLFALGYEDEFVPQQSATIHLTPARAYYLSPARNSFLTLPEELDTLLALVQALNQTAHKSFFRCCYWFEQALKANSYSLKSNGDRSLT